MSDLEINANPYIINQVSDDFLGPAEKCLNKYQFHASMLLIESRIKIRNLFSFHAIERNYMMRELLNIDPKESNYWEQHPIQNIETNC